MDGMHECRAQQQRRRWASGTAIALWLLLLLSLFAVAHSQPIPLSSAFDCSVEGAGRSGNALIVQDPNAWVSSPPLFLSSPSGVSSFQIAFWYRHLVPGKWPQIMVYELAPSYVGDNALLALFSYGVMMANVGAESYIMSRTAALLGLDWVHVAVSWQSASGQLRFFIDGAQDSLVNNIQQNWLLPSGGVLSIGQKRYSEVMFGFIDEFGLFATPLMNSDLVLLMGGQGAAAPTSAFLPSILSRGQAELFWTFDQPLHLDSDPNAEVIADESGKGNVARQICRRHCRPNIRGPSRLTATTTNSTTILFPVTGAPADQLLYLARLPSFPAALSPYAASSLTIDFLPNASLGTLYRVDPSASGGVGAALNVGDTVLASQMNPAVLAAGFLGVVLRTTAAFNMDSQFSMRYIVQPSDTSANSYATTLVFGANHAPTPAPPAGYLDGPTSSATPSQALQVLLVDEGDSVTFHPKNQRYPSVDFFAADPDGEDVAVYLVQLPHAGELYQNETDRAAGVRITSASFEQPVLVIGHTLVYVAPMFFSPNADDVVIDPENNSSTPWRPNATFVFSDGKQLSEHSVIRFQVQPVPHLPRLSPLSVEVAQGSLTLLTLPVDRSVLDTDDAPYLVITSLPSDEGALYQVLPDGGMGPLISNAASSNGGTTIAGSGSVTWSTDGSGLVDEESRQQLSQWLTRATAWSSVFPDPDGAWNASHILGPPDFFPSYGDSGLAWSGRITGDEEWIEVGFDTPVYITALEVFETYQPGHVVNILAKEPQSGQWQLIWHNEDVAPSISQSGIKANVLSPSLCPITFASNALRIETAPSGDSWVELDAVRVIGWPATADRRGRMDVSDPQGRVWFAAPMFTRGTVNFNFSASSCRYYSRYRQLGVGSTSVFAQLREVNHAPQAFNASVTTSSSGSATLRWMQLPTARSDPNQPGAFDPDGNLLSFELLSLPQRGRLWLVPGPSPAPVPDRTRSAPQGKSETNASGEGVEEWNRKDRSARSLTAAVEQEGAPLDERAVAIGDAELPLLAPAGSSLLFIDDEACDYDRDGPFLPTYFQYVAVDNGSPALRSPPVTVQVNVYCRRIQSDMPDAMRQASLALMSIGCVFCVFMGLLLFGHRRHPVIAVTSPLWHLVALVGVIGLYLSMLPILVASVSPARCMGNWIVYVFAVTLLFAALFAKTWRTWRIFTNHRLSQRALSDKDLSVVVVSFVVVQAVLLTAWFIVDPPSPRFNFHEDARHTVDVLCDAGGTVFRPLVLSVMGAMICATGVLTFLVRNVPQAFNEGAHIAFTSYALLVCWTLGIFVTAVVDRPVASALVRVVLFFVAATCAAIALFATKLFQLATALSAQRADPQVQVEQLRKRLHHKFRAEALARGLTRAAASAEARAQLDKYLQRQQEEQEQQDLQKQEQNNEGTYLTDGLSELGTERASLLPDIEQGGTTTGGRRPPDASPSALRPGENPMPAGGMGEAMERPAGTPPILALTQGVRDPAIPAEEDGNAAAGGGRPLSKPLMPNERAAESAGTPSARHSSPSLARGSTIELLPMHGGGHSGPASPYLALPPSEVPLAALASLSPEQLLRWQASLTHSPSSRAPQWQLTTPVHPSLRQRDGSSTSLWVGPMSSSSAASRQSSSVDSSSSSSSSHASMHSAHSGTQPHTSVSSQPNSPAIDTPIGRPPAPVNWPKPQWVPPAAPMVLPVRALSASAAAAAAAGTAAGGRTAALSDSSLPDNHSAAVASYYASLTRDSLPSLHEASGLGAPLSVLPEQAAWLYGQSPWNSRLPPLAAHTVPAQAAATEARTTTDTNAAGPAAAQADRSEARQTEQAADEADAAQQAPADEPNDAQQPTVRLHMHAPR